jgi:hypothetical protein
MAWLFLETQLNHHLFIFKHAYNLYGFLCHLINTAGKERPILDLISRFHYDVLIARV